MFSRLISTAGVLFSVLAFVSAHAIVEPVLGVPGTPVRNDVKRPSPAAPCGQNVNIASSLENSNAITARQDGSFVATALNFNGGRDGSRFFSAMVDSTGLGATFVNATVVQNGDLEPKTNAPQDLIVQLPASLKCTGGSSGDLCLVSFKQVAGFGNCVVVRHQGTIELQTSTVSGARPASATPKSTKTSSSSESSITSSVSAKQGNGVAGTSSSSARSSPSDEAEPAVTIIVTHTVHTSTITRTAFTSTSTVFDVTSSSEKASASSPATTDTARPEGTDGQSVSFGSLTRHLTIKTGGAEATKSRIRPSFTLINPSLTESAKESFSTGTATNGLFVPTGSVTITFSTPKPASRRLNFDFSLHGLRSRVLKQRLPLEH